jgi:hypothetical protein
MGISGHELAWFQRFESEPERFLGGVTRKHDGSPV